MAEWSERPHIRVAELAGPAPSDQLSLRLLKGTRKFACLFVFRGKELDLDAKIIEESRCCAREDAGLILSRAVDPARLGGPTPVRDAGLAADRNDAHKAQTSSAASRWALANMYSKSPGSVQEKPGGQPLGELLAQEGSADQRHQPPFSNRCCTHIARGSVSSCLTIHRGNHRKSIEAAQPRHDQRNGHLLSAGF